MNQDESECVTCGAPAVLSKGAMICAYCGTLARAVVDGVDRVGFQTLLAMLEDCSFDDGRHAALEAYVGVGDRRLTAGQVRKVLEAFTFDSGRLEALELLIPLTVNPDALFLIGPTFDLEPNRRDMFRELSRHLGVRSSEGGLGPEELSIFSRDGSIRGSSSPVLIGAGAYVAGILTVVLALYWLM